MTEAQERYVKLDRQKKKIDEYYEKLEEAILELEQESGIDSAFQDDEGIVYQVVIPQWTSVKMKHIDVIRTKREGERQGGLSVKKAEELGFKL